MIDRAQKGRDLFVPFFREESEASLTCGRKNNVRWKNFRDQSFPTQRLHVFRGNDESGHFSFFQEWKETVHRSVHAAHLDVFAKASQLYGHAGRLDSHDAARCEILE